MNKNKNVSTGVAFGIIIGLAYCILLFLRWQSASNFIRFAVLAFVSYIVVLSILFYEAFYRRRQEGGYITLKDLFQTLLITVLIFEFFYSLYNYIHLTYVDPDVVNRMKIAMEDMLDKAGSNITTQQKQDSLDRIEKLREATQFSKIITSYFTSIAISGVFALIISAIVKKKKPIFPETNL